MNLKTTVENAKLLDRGSNAAVEKSIDRVRLQASVFLHQLSQNIGFEVPAQHPIFAWAFCHAAWTISRYTVTAGVTPYEFAAGHKYSGKICEFACPVMVYVGDSVQQKADAKWRKGVFLGKTLTNDMFIVAVGGVIKLTRSMKAMFPNWSEHMSEYRQVLVYPWQLEGTIGNRIVPTLRRPGIEPAVVPGIDDEMAEDPPDEPLPASVIQELVPMTPIEAVEPVSRNRPPPETAVVSDPNGVRVEDPGAVQQDAVVEDAEQAGPPVPSLGIPGPTTPGMEESLDVTAAEMDMDETVEPDAKKDSL